MHRRLVRSLSLLPLLTTTAFETWLDFPEDADRLRQPKPSSWSQKPLGQWCRNMSANLHRQCPQGSALHAYDCCGASMTDCCVYVQRWVFLLTACIAFVALSTLTFHVLLRFNLVLRATEKRFSALAQQKDDSAPPPQPQPPHTALYLQYPAKAKA